MNKQELIDKAALALNGKLMRCDDEILIMDNWTKTFVSIKSDPGNGSYTYVCSASEFATRARELGWINGYKWGVEYPTNSKKPDLDGDIIISWKDKFGLGSTCKAGILNYQFGTIYEVVSFAVTDSRYKPKEQLLGNPEQLEGWFARGELPPVGVECEWVPSSPTKANWKRCVIDYIHGDRICVTNADSFKTKQVLHNVKFRPIKTQREKFIEAATSLVPINMNIDAHKAFALALYDAGFRAPEELK